MIRRIDRMIENKVSVWAVSAYGQSAVQEVNATASTLNENLHERLNEKRRRD